MKTCPNCNLHFNDGYVCPQCGGALYDQDPYAQQAAYPADPAAYGAYPAGYEQPYAQPTQPYGYAPQQPYVQQPAAYQPTQAYAAPEPAYAEPAPEPAPLPVATASVAAGAPPAKSSRGKTAAIVILAILAVALGAACAYLFLTNPPKQGPTELERTVVNEAWSWQTNVSDLLDEMDAAAATLNGTPESASADTKEPAAGTEGAANATAADAATANTEPTETPNEGAPSPADTASSSLAAEEPAAQAASTDTEPLTDDEAAALAEAEALVAAAEANAAERRPENAAAATNLEQMGTAGKLLGHMVTLAALASDDQMDTLNAPMQALSEDYPELVTAWDNVRDTVTTYLQEHLNSQDAAKRNTATAGPENADAPGTSANTGSASNAEAATNTENTANAAGANTATASDASANTTAWEQFLDAFRAARENFLQKANAAGFSLS